ncbi:MAG: hypothetical protein ACTHOK_03490 [Nocardioidaceae bacterium]
MNPLIEPQEIRVQRRYVRTRGGQELMDPRTGELAGVAVIQMVEERDDAEFVKVFAEGVRAAFELTRTGYRVFQAVLAIYQNTSMKGGYAEAVELFWFGDGLNGQALDMSEKTFQRGLKELLGKGFLAPKSASLFWVNPSLFFKGDRVAFIKEYRRRGAVRPIGRDPNTVDLLTGRTDNEGES